MTPGPGQGRRHRRTTQISWEGPSPREEGGGFRGGGHWGGMGVGVQALNSLGTSKLASGSKGLLTPDIDQASHHD